MNGRRSRGVAWFLLSWVIVTVWARAGASQEHLVTMSITFDDLPLHGTIPTGQTSLEVHQQIIAVLRKHHVPPTYGFINGIRVQETPALREVLMAWLNSGNLLGNHTFSHADLSKMSASAFNRDVQANETLLREVYAITHRQPQWHVFRYPYLREGASVAAREEVRAFLQRHGYRIAEVTVDFDDWAWNDPYARCLARGDDRALMALRRTYLSNARLELQWSVRTATDLYGRAIPHVLLLHVGAFDAVMLDDLLTQYENTGVHFISLDEALADSIYNDDSQQRGGELLDQLIAARHAPHPLYVNQPLELLDALCR